MVLETDNLVLTKKFRSVEKFWECILNSHSSITINLKSVKSTVKTEIASMSKDSQSKAQQPPEGHLLILGCSDRKIKNLNLDKAPALEVYEGSGFRDLRKYLKENGWPPGLIIKIIPAEDEIIDATKLINCDDRHLDEETTKAINLKDLGELRSIYINAGKDYQPTISIIEELYPPDRIVYAEGRTGKKTQSLIQWLSSLPNCTASVPFQQSDKRSCLYFFPDWDDYVYEPFHVEETDEIRKSERVERKYAYEIFGAETPYDGLLLSLAQLRTKKGPLNRLGKKDSLNFRDKMQVPENLLLFGDCGAFSYIGDSIPPLSCEEAASLYNQFGLDLGTSVDHIPISSISEKEKEKRMDLTAKNAKKFLEIHRAHKYQFVPVGSIQGVTSDDYAGFVHEYVEWGYKHIALGGLVRRRDSEILEIVAAVRKALQEHTRGEDENIWVHLFGVLRPDLQSSFQSLGVSSFDSASYLRKAWSSPNRNYLTADGKWYGSIRIPFSKSKAMREVTKSDSTISNQVMQELEKKCLLSLQRFGGKETEVQAVLEDINKYSALLQRKGTYNRFSEKHRELLENRPWEKCECQVCKDAGINIVIFRGANRNRRRGFHNTWVFYHKILHKGRKKSSRKSGT